MVDDGSTPGNKRKSAKAGFIPMKQAWLEQVATDPKLTPAALRVAVLLSNGFNSDTLETFIGRETLAGKLGIAPPNVSTAVKLLTDRGHVQKRTVRRNNHYKMLLKELVQLDGLSSDSNSDNSRTGIDPHTSQVLKSIPNRYEDQYTNREDNRSMNSAEGAYAPFGDAYGDTVQEETHAPEGARPSDTRSNPVDYPAALQEIIEAYPGPASQSERQFAYSAYERLLQRGAFHVQLLELAAAEGDTGQELDRFLWDLAETRWGRQKAGT